MGSYGKMSECDLDKIRKHAPTYYNTALPLYQLAPVRPQGAHFLRRADKHTPIVEKSRYSVGSLLHCSSEDHEEFRCNYGPHLTVDT